MTGDFDLDELLKRRLARRRRLAQLSFEEKIEIVERLRELRFNRDLMSARRAKPEGATETEGSSEEITHP
ncbi:MAG TPA: hypothetical protein VGW12_04145 [Pyrinomonadaceae bacterium]|nr:hypothetical protein [Pyrinomonadaceae bacterium]